MRESEDSIKEEKKRDLPIELLFSITKLSLLATYEWLQVIGSER